MCYRLYSSDIINELNNIVINTPIIDRNQQKSLSKIRVVILLIINQQWARSGGGFLILKIQKHVPQAQYYFRNSK